MSLTITHSFDEGTLVQGTKRGDGSRDVLRAHRLRWGRSIGCWFVPRSRDRAANRFAIDRLADALRAAGFDVTVEVDNAPTDVAEREQRRIERSEQRAERLDQRAERKEAESDAHHRRSRDAVAGIEPGQPILVGHHSQRRHERALERSHAAMGQSVQASHDAEAAEQGARAARAEADRRTKPAFIGRRIDQYEREVRKYAPRTDRPDLVIEAQAQLDYWTGLRAELGYRVWEPSDFQPGDLVRIRGSWDLVVKANRKTLTVQPAHVQWTMKYELFEVLARRRGEETITVMPDTEPGQVAA